MRALQGPIIGPLGGLVGASGVAAGGGSQILVGSNTTPPTTELTSDGGNYIYAQAGTLMASASGTPATISVYLGANLAASNVVFCLYTSSGSLVAQTVTGSFIANGWRTLAVTGTPGTVTSGQTYRIGVLPDGYCYLGSAGASTWGTNRYTSTYPTIPATLPAATNVAPGTLGAYASS